MAWVIYRVILCLLQSAFSSPLPVRDLHRTGCNTFSSHSCIPAPGIPSRRWDRRALPSSSSQASDAYVSMQNGKCQSKTSSVCLLDSAILLFRIPGKSPWLRHPEIPRAHCPLIRLPQSQHRLSLHPRFCPPLLPISYSAVFIFRRIQAVFHEKRSKTPEIRRAAIHWFSAFTPGQHGDNHIGFVRHLVAGSPV